MTRAARRASDRALVARIRAHRPTDADTARHEAGHVLAHVVHGVGFERVEMDCGVVDPHLGAELRARVVGDLDCDLHTGAVILWAGPAAEGHVYNSAVDLRSIRWLGEGFVTDRRPGSPHAVAHRLIADHQPHIDVLAGALQAERVLTRKRVLDVLQMA